MTGTLFKGRSQTNCQCFIGVAKRFDGDNLRFTFSQCPGFIKYDCIKRTGALQRMGIRVSAVFMGEDSAAGAAAQIYGKNMARIRGMDQLARAAGRLIQNEIRELGD